MNLIEPLTITDAILTSSTVSENDHAAWSAGTTYADGDRVIVVSTHRIYESLINGNIGNNPTTDDGTRWLNVSATNRWKAFDTLLSDFTTRSGSMTYVLAPTKTVDAIALFGLNATSVTISVVESATTTYNQTFQLVDNSPVIDWFTYFFEAITYVVDKVVTGIPGYAGSEVTILVTAATGNSELGELVVGRLRNLGTSLAGTRVGIEDYSRKDRDEFGRATIVERAFASTANYNFALVSGDERRVSRLLESLRATPAVYFADADVVDSMGALVYGFFRDFDIPLSGAGSSTASLEIEGLT